MDTPTWPSGSLVTITASDATVFTPALRQIYVGGGGDITVETEALQTVVFKSVPAGSFIGPF